MSGDDANTKVTSHICPLCSNGVEPTPGMLTTVVGSTHRSTPCWLCGGTSLLSPQEYEDWANDGQPREKWHAK